jgi:hypothetical protein
MDELNEVAGQEIQQRWDVLDADGERVGEVAEVGERSFVLETSLGTRLDIGFTDIESADDGRVTLMISGDELTSDLEAG